MTDFTVRRVVVACDAICELDVAIETATRLAVHWHASVLGVFLEDSALRTAASLPFVRQVTLSPGASESLDPSDLEQQFRSMAGQAQRKLAAAASRLGLDWSFSEQGEEFSQQGIGDFRSDLLVIETYARAFAGQFKLPSHWAKLPYRTKLPVLLLRGNRQAGRNVVVLFDPAVRAAMRSLTAAAEMAAFGRRRLVVLAKEPVDEAGVRSAIAAVAGPGVAAQCRIQPCRNPTAISEQTLTSLDAGLLVIDATAGDGEAADLEALVARTTGDVLLVR